MEEQTSKTFINSILDSHIDSDVHQDILKNHAKESITLLNFGNINISNVNSKIIQQVEFSETEISPFHKNDIDCTAAVDSVCRKPSTYTFNQQKISFPDLQALLIRSFSPGENGRRHYPSAGGLYPVEPLVFLFPERIEGFSHKPGCYHFRPLKKKLQLLKTMSGSFFFDNILHGLIDKKHHPCFSILYLANVGKAIFKYRYRGYRHALMEAGSMYQQATRISDEAGLRTTVWSSFSDQQLNHALELDHSTYLPLTLQFFGYGD
ncbi:MULTISPECIES: SagB/ThcOx family dehydrogenase [unclassified Legionella]|uniref:SagB/ThcOx family dehydrogenase n=1 Tax=unclassified Legionella TaxID=2622702 RepID=UPI00105632E2|nr:MULTISPECIES: SagB/ThcOx family dehydrogenase [unclassified Legionella]MDI9817798.1 SagB/ThcOx family dehydrogenase [Legionella sp. PL877]